jgi:DNA-binding MarR family transcriptional regulator
MVVIRERDKEASGVPLCRPSRIARFISAGDRLTFVAHARRRRVDYAMLADLRYQLRRFLGRRENAARSAGVEPQQFALLLQLKGLEGRRPTTIGALAERLQIRHHSAVELVDRLVARRMVDRRRNGDDGRAVEVTLRPAGEAVLRRLALYSTAELRSDGPALVTVLRRLMRRQRRTANGSKSQRRGGVR